jgi:hypothetical protein
MNLKGKQISMDCMILNEMYIDSEGVSMFTVLNKFNDTLWPAQSGQEKTVELTLLRYM